MNSKPLAKLIFPKHARMQSTHHHFDQVLTKKHHNAIVVVLNRPKALNALNLPMVRHLLPLYEEWENDASVSAIVMKGEGRAFCAGGDIVHIYESGLNKTRDAQDFFFEEYLLNYRIGTLKTPHVAILNGITMGGGVGLSVHGSFRVATENTLFSMPETGIGFFPDVGGTYFLPRLNRSLGTFLALTGCRLKGKAIKAAGIATHFVPSSHIEQLEGEISEIKGKDASKVTHVLGKYAQPCHWGETDFSEDTLGMIERVFSKNSMEEIIEGLKNENSEFAAKQLATLHKNSPFSLKVTFEQMKRGKSLDLRQSLELEYAMSQNFMRGHDFYEGVRELLVTKSNSPQWKPSSLQQINNEQVQSYFHYPAGIKKLDLSKSYDYYRQLDSKL